jgi:SH3-like domain-containing protein
MRCLLVVIACLSLSSPLNAQDAEQPTPSGQNVPRFVSLKFDVANGRIGPSREHQIDWQYVRAGLPMEIIAETPSWRRVRDPEGVLTWMHKSLLSGRRSAVARQEAPLYARADLDAPQKAIADIGAVLSLERCRVGWCRVEAQGFRGWVQTHLLWGVYQNELEEDFRDEVDGSGNLSASLPRDTALR